MGGSRLTIKIATDRRGLSCNRGADPLACLLVCYRPLAHRDRAPTAQLAILQYKHALGSMIKDISGMLPLLLLYNARALRTPHPLLSSAAAPVSYTHLRAHET